MQNNDDLTASQSGLQASHLHWQTLLQITLSLLWALNLILGAFFFALLSLGRIFVSSSAQVDTTSGLLWAAGLSLSGLILVLSAGVALLNLFGRRQTCLSAFVKPVWAWLPSALVLVVLPIVLVAGHFVISNTQLSWLFLPPLHLLAVSIPVFWLMVIGLRGLPVGTAQRSWGLFSVGVAFSPFLILTVEMILLGVFVVLGLALLAGQPDQLEELLRLAERIQLSPPAPEVILRILQPYLLRPEVLGLGFIFLAVCVPLVEEILKPIGLWFLARRRLSPVEGYTAGLITGAGYALFENIFLSSTTQQWTTVILARAGTTAVHMLTTALVGWGLASAWSEGRYGRLGLSFCTAVLVHSLWNGLTLLMTAQVISEGYLTASPILIQMEKLAPAGLGVLALFSFLFIWGSNRRLKRAIIHQLS